MKKIYLILIVFFLVACSEDTIFFKVQKNPEVLGIRMEIENSNCFYKVQQEDVKALLQDGYGPLLIFDKDFMYYHVLNDVCSDYKHDIYVYENDQQLNAYFYRFLNQNQLDTPVLFMIHQGHVVGHMYFDNQTDKEIYKTYVQLLRHIKEDF